MAKRYVVTCDDCGYIQEEWDFNADDVTCDNCGGKKLKWVRKRV